MADVDALLARKRTLTEQLRRIDEAVDTEAGARAAEPGDWQWRTRDDGGVDVLISDRWWETSEAVELTRAGLYEADEALEAEGLL